ncbi:MAG: SoxR reducing system RseC family protein [Spirochaetales bacterium]|nr:SoxR reducing system RseC family protein [Spirochaetales bacterium]
MRERAIVKSIDGNMVTVSIEMQEGCGVCGNSACKMRKSNLQVYNRDNVPVHEGEEVIIEVPATEQAKSAFWVLGLPLIMLFVGYGIGALLFGTESEGPAVACAGAGFVIALVVGMLVQRRNRLESFPMLIGQADQTI